MSLCDVSVTTLASRPETAGVCRQEAGDLKTKDTLTRERRLGQGNEVTSPNPPTSK